MTTSAQQPQKRWYNDKELFLHGLVRSNYVTAITDWFMSFAGKWAELVLYATVLYSCAELYPGVTLPAGLSLAVFLVQLGALDIGGLSLAKLAKQAREDGNTAGAKNAETLSKWLIGIMLVGVVTVGLEHALPVALPSWVIVSINVALVVARSICAVLYGRVVHDLKQELVRMMPVTESDQRIEHLISQFNRRLEVVQSELVEQVHTAIAQITVQVQTAQAAHLEQKIAVINEQIAAQVEQLCPAQNAAIPVQVSASTPQSNRSNRRRTEWQSRPDTRLHMVASREHQEPIDRIRQVLKLEPGCSDRRLASLAKMAPATAKKYRALLEQGQGDQAV